MAKRQRSTSESCEDGNNTKKKKPKHTTRHPIPRARDIQAPSVLTSRQPIALNGEAPMYFRNHADSRAPMTQIQWFSPTPDPSIPRTEAAERAIVRQLTAAFTNLDHANDSSGSKYKKRLDPASNYYQPWAIEACAWDIMASPPSHPFPLNANPPQNEVKKIHTHGFKYDKIFDKDLIKAMEQTKNLFFDERINIICRMIENSKFVAVNLLKDEKLITTIAAPFKLYASSLSNNASNKKRNALLVAGRKVGNAKEKSGEARGPPASPSPEDVAAEAMLVLSSSANLDVINHRR
ncbi:hypothetical protein N0V95_007722 [Ascochyta clinopodiicola]|nr:hypothetical protein N0V95_007722 [Ascochyta clinopodiicola]